MECWICLQEGESSLFCPCDCPRHVHARCLAMWQFENICKPEETMCRFCHLKLPDWRWNLVPIELRPFMYMVKPVIGIYVQGTKKYTVVPKWYDCPMKINDWIRHHFDFIPEHHVNIQCLHPVTGEKIIFDSLKDMHAALFCAAIQCARKQLKNTPYKRQNCCKEETLQ